VLASQRQPSTKKSQNLWCAMATSLSPTSPSSLRWTSTSIFLTRCMSPQDKFLNDGRKDKAPAIKNPIHLLTSIEFFTEK